MKAPKKSGSDVGKLLLRLFTDAELRRFLRRHYGSEITRALPGSGVSPAQLSFDAIGVLERRGLIDADLFRAMLEERPGQKWAIERVATAQGIALGPSGVAASDQEEDSEDDEAGSDEPAPPDLSPSTAALPETATTLIDLEPFEAPTATEDGLETTAEPPAIGSLEDILPPLGDSGSERPGVPTPAFWSPQARELSYQLGKVLRATRGSGASKSVDSLRERLREGGRLQPGDHFEHGRFLLLDLLGSGSSGDGWKAWDTLRTEQVALRLLHPHWASQPANLSRFLEAVATLAQLEHPHCAQILDPRIEDDRWFGYAMELLHDDLDARVLGAGYTPAAALEIIDKVGSALLYAHSVGLTHGDMKPANVMFARDGEPRVKDFGLARVVHTSGGTRAGGAVEAIVFVAPESLTGSSTGPASDLYGLAMTAVFALRGDELPVSVLRNPGPVVEALPVTRQVKELLLGALSWDPTERPSLERFLGGLRTHSKRRAVTQKKATPVVASNPFRPGAPLAAAEAPPGRSEDISRLLSRLSSQGSAVLLGPRRAGKTSILRHLQHRLEGATLPREGDGASTVYFASLEGVPCASPDDLARALDPSLADASQPATAFRHALREAETRPVILIDEVGYLRRADLSLQPAVFGWLRGLGQNHANLIYAGSPRDWHEAHSHAQRQPGSSFGNDLQLVVLGPLSDGAAHAFLEATAPTDVPISRTVAEWIIRRVGTWPFYLQVMGEALVNEVRAGRVGLLDSDHDFDALVRQSLLVGYSLTFADRWRDLPRPAKQALLSVDEAPPDFEELSPARRRAVREAFLYDGLTGWTLDADPPFKEWIRVKRTELLDAIDEESKS